MSIDNIPTTIASEVKYDDIELEWVLQCDNPEYNKPVLPIKTDRGYKFVVFGCCGYVCDYCFTLGYNIQIPDNLYGELYIYLNKWSNNYFKYKLTNRHECCIFRYDDNRRGCIYSPNPYDIIFNDYNNIIKTMHSPNHADKSMYTTNIPNIFKLPKLDKGQEYQYAELVLSPKLNVGYKVKSLVS